MSTSDLINAIRTNANLYAIASGAPGGTEIVQTKAVFLRVYGRRIIPFMETIDWDAVASELNNDEGNPEAE